MLLRGRVPSPGRIGRGTCCLRLTREYAGSAVTTAKVLRLRKRDVTSGKRNPASALIPLWKQKPASGHPASVATYSEVPVLQAISVGHCGVACHLRSLSPGPICVTGKRSRTLLLTFTSVTLVSTSEAPGFYHVHELDKGLAEDGAQAKPTFLLFCKYSFTETEPRSFIYMSSTLLSLYHIPRDLMTLRFTEPQILAVWPLCPSRSSGASGTPTLCRWLLTGSDQECERAAARLDEGRGSSPCQVRSSFRSKADSTPPWLHPTPGLGAYCTPASPDQLRHASRTCHPCPPGSDPLLGLSPTSAALPPP